MYAESHSSESCEYFSFPLTSALAAVGVHMRSAWASEHNRISQMAIYPKICCSCFSLQFKKLPTRDDNTPVPQKTRSKCSIVYIFVPPNRGSLSIILSQFTLDCVYFQFVNTFRKVAISTNCTSGFTLLRVPDCRIAEHLCKLSLCSERSLSTEFSSDTMY